MKKAEYVHIYDKNRPFKNCSCPECEKHYYTLEHRIKPLELPEKLVKAIEVLLWYSPNNSNSQQSSVNEYLKDTAFDDAVMTYFLRYMNMESEDICFISNGSIDQSMVFPYIDKACVSCQKIIVKHLKPESTTRIDCITNHMRNCLAHGRFNFLSEESIIGFDVDGRKRYTAVFKLNISTLYNFCQQLITFPDFTVSHIIQYLLRKQNYKVLATMGKHITHEDIRKDEELVFARKDSVAFRINCSRFITGDPIRQYRECEEYSPDYDEDFNLYTKYKNIFYTETPIQEYETTDEPIIILTKEKLKESLSKESFF